VHVVNNPRKKFLLVEDVFVVNVPFQLAEIFRLFFYNLLASADQIWNIIP